MMNYRIENKPEIRLTGCKRRFTGSPIDRNMQDHDFACATRLEQALLQWEAHDCDTTYNVLTNFLDDGYDYYIASLLPPEEDRESLEEDFGAELASRFEALTIPGATYLVCETERCEYPTNHVDALYRRAVTEWLPSSGYELADAPEIDVVHWFYTPGDKALNSSRYIELWLPIEKKKQ